MTRDRGAVGLSLTGVTRLCPSARHVNPSLVLVQPRKTSPYITERLLMGRKESNQTNKQDRLTLNAGQKYCRMLQGEHSAILSTFIKLQFVIKIFVLCFFEWPFYTDFTVYFSISYFQFQPIT